MKYLFKLLRPWPSWLYLGALVSLCALEVALGALPTRIYAHDYFIFLDGAWRVAAGQIPSRDFYSGYGVFVWIPLRWGLALRGNNPDSLGVVRAFYTAVIGLWFLFLIRLAPRRALWLFTGFFLLMFVSTARPLGEHPTWVSHAMFYNRAAYALLFLIIFEQLGTFRFEAADHPISRQPRSTTQFWGGVSTGAALAFAPMVKVWYLLPAVAVIVTGLLLFGLDRRRLSGMFTGALAAVGLATAFLHLQPLAFVHEALTLNQQRGSIAGGAVNALVKDLGLLVFTLAAGWAVSRAGFSNRRIAYKYVLATVTITLCDLYCRANNPMNADLPLAAFWCLSGAIMLAGLKRQRVVAVLVACPLAIPMFLADCAGSAYAAYKTATTHASLRFDSPVLRNWVPQEWLGADPNFVSRNGTPLILATNDGIHLLQSLSRPEETVFCVAYTNAFSFALQRRPALGGAVWLGINSDFGLDHPLPENRLLGHPDLLMVEQPNYVEEPTTKALLALYPSLLTKEFALVGSSRYWTLYRRRE